MQFEEDSGFDDGLTNEQISRIPTRVFKSGTSMSKNRKSWTKYAGNLDTTNTEELSGSAKFDGGDSKGAKGVEAGDAMKECLICISNFVNYETLRVLNCFHEFHKKCIDKWIRVRMVSIQIRLRIILGWIYKNGTIAVTITYINKLDSRINLGNRYKDICRGTSVTVRLPGQ